jgi:PhnB protein
MRDSPPEEDMSTNVRPIPAGYHSVSPSLTCRDASAAIDFYKQVFGASEVMRMSGPGGKIMHAELKIGDSHIFLNDEMPPMAVAPSPSAPVSVSMFVYTEDVDSIFQRAIAAGAKSIMQPEDMFWGDRYAKFTDPFGHAWGVATHVEDVAPEEMSRRQQEWMDQMASRSKAAAQS